MNETHNELIDGIGFSDTLDHPSWAINDSITMVIHHALELVKVNAITNSQFTAILDALPHKQDTPKI